jgi:hypothetical protein
MSDVRQPDDDDGVLPDVTQPVAGPPANVPLVGEALITARRLRRSLGGISYREVVYLGLAVLKQAEGKDVIVQDPATGVETPISLPWV